MQMRRDLALFALAGAAFVGACRDDAGRDAAPGATAAESLGVPDEQPDSQTVARARDAANGLGKDLQARLFAALDSGGPALAVTFCADSAQAWTARHAQEAVYVRRVSQRVRNPANRPDSVEARELVRLDSLHRAGTLPGEVVRQRVAENGARVVEYMRPILVQERCLTCHGPRDQIAPAVRALIAERYPSDSATGYSAGELRGMISVRVQP